MEKKHNYFYKITNLVNGKYYYGIHSTNNLEDGYIGSGLTILKAVKKYGRSSFIKEIVVDYPTRKEVSDHEALVVTLEVVECRECYNLQTGGSSEFTASEATRKKMSESTRGEKHPMFGKTTSEETKRKISEAQIGKIIPKEARKKMSEARVGKYCGNNSHHFGKTTSEETKRKISESKIGKCLGENNSYFGKTHSEETKTKMRNKPSCIPCEILDETYISVAEASRILKIPYNTIVKRLRNKSEKFKDWNYCEAII